MFKAYNEDIPANLFKEVRKENDQEESTNVESLLLNIV